MRIKRCCVPNCSNEGPSIRHTFPVFDEHVFKIWVNRIANPKFVGRGDMEIYRTYVVCGNHFTDECRSVGTKRLKLYSLPTLHLPGFNGEPTLENSFWKVHAGMKEKHRMACQQGPVGESSTQVQNCGISPPVDPVRADASVNTGPVGTFPTPTYTYGRKSVCHLNLDSSTPLSSTSGNETGVFTRPQVSQSRCAAVQKVTRTNEPVNPELQDYLDYQTSVQQIKREYGESQDVTAEDNSTAMLLNILESQTGPFAVHKATSTTGPITVHKATSTETLVESELLNSLDFQSIEQIKIELDESQAVTEHQEYNLFSESPPPSVDPLAEDCSSSGEPKSVKNLCRLCTESVGGKDPLAEDCSSSGEPKSLKNLCRLCTESVGGNAVNLFVGKYLEREIFAMLNTLLPDTFAEMDGLSQLVCTACVNKVNLCYDTVQTFVSADKKLREMLKDQQKGEQLESQGVASKEDTSCVTNDRTSEIVKSHVKVLLKHKSPQIGLTLMCSGCKHLFTDQNIALQHKNMKCTTGNVTLLRVKFKCFQCEKLFTNKAAVLEHKKVHSPELLICHICGRGIKKMSAMKNHLQGHENKEYKEKTKKKLEHICHICGRVLKSKKFLNNHLLKHETKPLSYVCSICGSVYKHLSSLQIHERRHRDHLEPASCPLCKKNLRSKVHLQSHLVWTHSEKKKRLCHLCGTLLSSEEKFKIHLEEHMGLNINCRGFKCMFCDKSFRQKYLLSHHVRRHTGVRDFKCTICNKAFYTKKHLQNHSLAHSSLRPHKCDACSTTFKWKATLMRHKARGCIPVKRSLLCSICSIKLPSVADVKKHQKEKHSSHELSKAYSLDTISVSYLCTDCNVCFETQEELLIHNYTEHSSVSSPSEPNVDAGNQEVVYSQNKFSTISPA